MRCVWSERKAGGGRDAGCTLHILHDEGMPGYAATCTGNTSCLSSLLSLLSLMDGDGASSGMGHLTLMADLGGRGGREGSM